MDVPAILEAINAKELFSHYVLSHGTGLEVSIKPEQDGQGFILKVNPLPHENFREEKDQIQQAPPDWENRNKFHSGKKLRLFRQIRGFSQAEVLALKHFPNAQMDTRALRKWEKNGVPKIHVEAVVQACGYENWVFLDNRLTSEQFERITLHPDLQGNIRKELYAISS